MCILNRFCRIYRWFVAQVSIAYMNSTRRNAIWNRSIFWIDWFWWIWHMRFIWSWSRNTWFLRFWSEWFWFITLINWFWIWKILRIRNCILLIGFQLWRMNFLYRLHNIIIPPKLECVCCFIQFPICVRWQTFRFSFRIRILTICFKFFLRIRFEFFFTIVITQMSFRTIANRYNSSYRCIMKIVYI